MAGSPMAAVAMLMRKKAAPRGGGAVVSFSLTAIVLLAGCSSAALPETATPQTSLAAGAPRQVAVRLPEAETLVGLGAGELVARLGEPGLRRREPPAELWQYRSADCVLEVILYAQSGAPHVVGSEIYARSADGTARCPSLSVARESGQSRL